MLIRNSLRYGASAAPAIFAPNAVIFNPRTSLGWTAGFADSATFAFNVWVNGNIGSPAHLSNNETGSNTMMNRGVFGNLADDPGGFSAENNRGIDLVYDNSPNMPARLNVNDTTITPATEATHSSIQTVLNNPQDGNDKWVCWTGYGDISVISGATARGALWRTILGQAPVKLVDGLPITNGNPSWVNGGTQKIGLGNVLGFFLNVVDFANVGRFLLSDFWLATPPSGFIDASNNLVVGLGKLVTAGGMPVDQTAGGTAPNGNASGISPLRFLSGNRTAFMIDKSANAANPAIHQTTLRSHLYNAPLGPGATPDRPYLVWTHSGPMPTTAVHSFAGMQFYGAEIRKDDGLLISVRLTDNTSTTLPLNPIVTAAGGATYAAVLVPNSRQQVTGTREMETVQYLIRMDTRDITVSGADYGFQPTISWDVGDTLFNNSMWQASIIRNIDWVNGPIDVSAGTTEAGGVPGSGTGFLRCPSVTPSIGKRLMVNTFFPYDTSDGALTDAGPPINAGQELWWEAMTVAGGGPMITYELWTGDGVTATGNRDAQYSGTTVRNNIGLTAVFR